MQLTCRNTASIEGQICPKQMKAAGEFRLDDNIRILKLVILLGLGEWYLHVHQFTQQRARQGLNHRLLLSPRRCHQSALGK
jgi:hypothetical protein